jgi:hypothetical protein
MFGLSVRCCAQARKALLPHVELGTDPFQNGILSDIDTVRPVYTLTCPNCGNKIRVPAGPHTLVATPSRRATPSGITIDGKAVHRCKPRASTATR